MGVPAELTTSPDFVQVRLALVRYLGGPLEAMVFARIQYRTHDESRAWVEHAGKRWWTVTIADLAAELGVSDKQIRRVLDLLTDRGALVREHLSQNGPYDRRWSYSPVILDVPSRANEAPSAANVQAPSRADVDLPSGANLSSLKNDEEGERSADAAPSPFCSKHPDGTEGNCGPCGTARRRAERWQAPTARPTPVPRVADTLMCAEHPEYPIEIDGSCTRCSREHTEAEPLQIAGAA